MALWLAFCEFSIRHHGPLRLFKGQLLLLQGLLESRTSAPPLPALELAEEQGRAGDQRLVLFQPGIRGALPQWKVKFAPGAIEARGSTDGRVVLKAKRETTGEPAKIVLRPDRTQIGSGCGDVTIINVEIQDAQGRCVPTASNEISFRVTGVGRLLGVGNGDPSS